MTVKEIFDRDGYTPSTCKLVASKLAFTARREQLVSRLEYCIKYRRKEFLELYNINKKNISNTSMLNRSIRVSINRLYKKYN